MLSDRLKKSYEIKAFWGPRGETPEALGTRFGAFMDGLAKLDPRLVSWRVGMRPQRYENVRGDLAAFFSRNVAKDDFGVDYPEEGYDVMGLTRVPDREAFGIGGSVGASIGWAVPNRFRFETGYADAPDYLNSLTFDFLRSVLLEIIEAWQPTACAVRPSDLHKFVELLYFSADWISYVPPEWADTVQLPDIPLIETLPGGGLLLSATTERFETSNPEHLAAARRIGAAIRHLNTGRWSPAAHR